MFEAEDRLIDAIKSYVDRKISSIPAPEKGEKGDKGDAFEASEVKKLVDEAISSLELPAGKDGKDGAAGEKGQDGRDGKDGKNALDIEILPDIDLEKSYKRGVYAMFKGGIWRSFQKTSGLHGWEIAVNGLAQIKVENIDNRNFKIVTEKSNGDIEEQSFYIPAMIYRGVYKQDEKYQHGDTVTYAGNLYHCDEDTTERPGSAAKSWSLAVKKGGRS